MSSLCELLRNLQSRPASCATWVRSSPTRFRGLTGVLLLLKRAKLLAGDPEVASSSFSVESSENPSIAPSVGRAGVSAGGKIGELEISSRKTGGIMRQVRDKKKTMGWCGTHNVCLRHHVSTFRLQTFSKAPTDEMAPVRKVKDQGGESKIRKYIKTCQLIHFQSLKSKGTPPT